MKNVAKGLLFWTGAAGCNGASPPIGPDSRLVVEFGQKGVAIPSA